MASRWRLTFGSLGSAAPVPLQRSPLFRSHRLCLLFCFARGPPPAAGGLPPMAACPAPAAALSVCTGPRPRGRVLLLLFALAAAAPHPPSGLVGRSVGRSARQQARSSSSARRRRRRRSCPSVRPVQTGRPALVDLECPVETPALLMPCCAASSFVQTAAATVSISACQPESLVSGVERHVRRRDRAPWPPMCTVQRKGEIDRRRLAGRAHTHTCTQRRS
jgi:hypothetical protein